MKYSSTWRALAGAGVIAALAGACATPRAGQSAVPSGTVREEPQARESDRHPSDPQPTPTQGKLMETNGNPVSVGQSEEFEIRLAATPTTGYTWQVVNAPPQIQALGNSYVQPTQGQPVAGGSGVQVFRFRALQAGSYTLTFELKRPWESQPQQSRTVQVQVHA